MHIDIGLSVSVNIRVEKCPAELAKWTMERGSHKSVANSVVGTDSFAAFVNRCKIFLEGTDEKHKKKRLNDANIQYAGSPVTSLMYYAIKASIPFSAGESGRALDRLRREFGRDCMTKGYSKMYCLARLCNKVGQA